MDIFKKPQIPTPWDEKVDPRRVPPGPPEIPRAPWDEGGGLIPNPFGKRKRGGKPKEDR
ncbi:MAG TPA: hypothetical protein VFJ16_10340 [Longimicrobium sp.]|nr:hypothetical protein [Longimicrobium sp.]